MDTPGEPPRGPGNGDHPAGAATGQPAPPSAPSSAQPRLRALVVDDTAVNQKLACSLLARAQYDTVVVEDGQAAVDIVAREDFNLVLMDLQMPVLGGIDAARLIRDWERKVGGHVPIIAVTARTVDGDRDACLAAGMDGFLRKPVRAEELFAMIDAVGGRRHPATEPGTRVASATDDVFDAPELLASVQGDRALARELGALFLTDAPRQVAAMRDAIECGDARRLQFSAHALKGSAMTLTARRVAVHARALESMGTDGNMHDASGAVAQLESALQQLGVTITNALRDD